MAHIKFLNSLFLIALLMFVDSLLSDGMDVVTKALKDRYGVNWKKAERGW